MSPPPTRGRRRGDDFDDVLRRVQKRRGRVQKKRRRRASLILGVLVALAVGMLAAGFGGAAAFESSCSLSALPAPGGVDGGVHGLPLGNSFIYAANGSLLGSIPERRIASPSTSRGSAPGWRRRRSQSRTSGSTSTAASTTRGSSALRSRTFGR